MTELLLSSGLAVLAVLIPFVPILVWQRLSSYRQQRVFEAECRRKDAAWEAWKTDYLLRLDAVCERISSRNPHT